MGQVQGMTGLTPHALAQHLGVNPSVVWKDVNGVQDMGALRRLISMIQLITTNRGEETTFDLGDFEIVVRGKKAEL